MKNEIKSCWLWPDHAIGKTASRMLREEHNTLVNGHAALLSERDGLKDLLLHTQRTAIAVAEERDRLSSALSQIIADDRTAGGIVEIARAALAEGGK